MKTPIVFSLVREQSVFMTAIMSLLSFLAVLALGVLLFNRVEQTFMDTV